MSPAARSWHIVRLGALFLQDLAASSVQVARAALDPRRAPASRFCAVRLRAASTDLEIMLVANYITLTPGTVTIDVSADRSTLLVHSLLAGEDSSAVCAEINDAIETRVLRATRG
jgi:multicomponent Na+:H+ antiporter subunit E